MKKMILFALSVGVLSCMNLEAQEQTANENALKNEQSQVKGESKIFYEFDQVYDFKLINLKGERVKEGRAQFVDVSELPDGDYFFEFNGKKVHYSKGMSSIMEPSNKIESTLKSDRNASLEESIDGTKAKLLYEFGGEYEFELYDGEGQLIKKGKSQFVDVTHLTSGTYYFRFNGKNVRYHKK